MACRYECLLRRWLLSISKGVLCICPVSVSANPFRVPCYLLTPRAKPNESAGSGELQKSPEIFNRKVSPFVK